MGRSAATGDLGRLSRAVAVRALVCLGLAVGVVLAHRLYLTHTSYPMVPIAGVLPPLPAPLDQAVLGTFVTLLVLAAALPRSAWPLIGALAMAAVLAVWDQSRWQPWFCQYVLMLIALLSMRREGSSDSSRALGTCRAIVALTYVWSGLQKLNVTYATLVFPWLVEPLTRSLPGSFTAWLPTAAVLTALLETAIGIALFIPWLRKPAVIAAVATHALVVAMLGPWGHGSNRVVLPWNIAMAALAVALFWNVSSPIPMPRRLDRHAVAVTLVGVMPALSFVGLWDSYLSGALYSGNIAEAVIAVSPTVKPRLPPEMLRYVITNRQNVDVLVVGDWSLGEVATPPYPQARVYRALARHVCAHAAGAPTEVRLVIFERPRPWAGSRQTTTADCTLLGDRRG
jgi:hypothetical protein